MTPAWANPEPLRGGAANIDRMLRFGAPVVFSADGDAGGEPGGADAARGAGVAERAKPVRPSRAAVDPEFAGDLDNIALKVPEFSSEDRYRTVELLADDVRAHLGSRPISARTHTW